MDGGRQLHGATGSMANSRPRELAPVSGVHGGRDQWVAPTGNHSSAVRTAVRNAASQVKALQGMTYDRKSESEDFGPLGGQPPQPLHDGRAKTATGVSSSRRRHAETLPPARPRSANEDGSFSHSFSAAEGSAAAAGLRRSAGSSAKLPAANSVAASIWAAVQKHVPQMLEWLDSNGGPNLSDECGWTPLHWASLTGRIEHVVALLDSGVEPQPGATLPLPCVFAPIMAEIVSFLADFQPAARRSRTSTAAASGPPGRRRRTWRGCPTRGPRTLPRMPRS